MVPPWYERFNVARALGPEDCPDDCQCCCRCCRCPGAPLPNILATRVTRTRKRDEDVRNVLGIPAAISDADSLMRGRSTRGRQRIMKTTVLKTRRTRKLLVAMSLFVLLTLARMYGTASAPPYILASQLHEEPGRHATPAQR